MIFFIAVALKKNENNVASVRPVEAVEVSLVFPPNNIQETISPFWLVKSSAFFLNSAEKS